LFLFHNAPADLEIGVDLNQVHTTCDGGPYPGDQFADAVEERRLDLHEASGSSAILPCSGRPSRQSTLVL